MKKCSKCENVGDSFFNKSQLSINTGLCISCERNRAKIRYLKDKDKVLKRNNDYQKNNKEKIKEKSKKYRNKNIDKIKENSHKYYIDNKDKIKSYNSNYYKDNSERIKLSNANYKCNKRKNNKVFCIKESISKNIRRLLNSKSTKNRKSVLFYLNFTLQDLKNHIENIFLIPGNEWMNWGNHGIYKKKDWDDNDQLTWKWQLDHIIPHSSFKYTSMEDESFKQCWALSNLRPYSAKQNIIDGDRR